MVCFRQWSDGSCQSMLPSFQHGNDPKHSKSVAGTQSWNMASPDLRVGQEKRRALNVLQALLTSQSCNCVTGLNTDGLTKNLFRRLPINYNVKSVKLRFSYFIFSFCGFVFLLLTPTVPPESTLSILPGAIFSGRSFMSAALNCQAAESCFHHH